MSSIRNLKKDIDYMIYEVVSDCFTAMSVQPMEKSEDLAELVADTIKLRNELFSRIKHPGGKDNPALMKQYYKKLEADLIDGVDKLLIRLSKITTK